MHYECRVRVAKILHASLRASCPSTLMQESTSSLRGKIGREGRHGEGGNLVAG